MAVRQHGNPQVTNDRHVTGFENLRHDTAAPSASTRSGVDQVRDRPHKVVTQRPVRVEPAVSVEDEPLQAHQVAEAHRLCRARQELLTIAR
jgi:hypothetical protein